MGRWIWNWAAAVSLGVGVCVCVVWVRAQWVQDSYQTADRIWEVGAEPNGVVVVFASRPYWAGQRYRSFPSSTWSFASFRWIPRSVPAPFGRQWSGWGFAFMRYTQKNALPDCTFTSVMIPYWVMLVGAGVGPAVWWRRRPSRLAPGCCLGCGYDLRATPERCPECGREVGVVGAT